MRVSVVGLGRLGAPLAAILAEAGAQVIGVDHDAGVVERIAGGSACHIEPGLQQLIARAGTNLSCTTDTARAVAGSDVTFIIVPTPSSAAGDYANDQLLDAVAAIGKAIARKADKHLVVIISTVMPGTMNEIIRPALERACERTLGADLGLCYCPEFVALGAVIAGMQQPDLVLIGQSDAEAGAQLVAVLRPIWTREPTIWQLNFIDAEIAKIAVNGFVTTKISYANMLSELCERLPGADAGMVTAVLGSDSRIGPAYLSPGLGFGGPCFPRDNAAIAALARRAGVDADIAEATDTINARQADRIVAMVRSRIATGTIGVLGLAYKPGSDVYEASQGLEIAQKLAILGYRVLAHDPVARPHLPAGAERVDDANSCSEKCDLLVIATPWPEYGALDPAAFARPGGKLVIIDCWRTVALLPLSGIVELVYPGRHC